MLSPKVSPPDAEAPAGTSPSRGIGNGPAANGAFGRAADLTIHTARPTKARKVSLRAPKPVSPEDVLRAFNTWSFKREQPENAPLMRELIAAAIARLAPVSFVLYWGKGPRSRPGDPEIACLDFLSELARRVRDVYEPGAIFKLIFTDTHARLNGHSPQSVAEYFGAVDSEARARGFESCWLGDLVEHARAAGVPEPDDADVPEEMLEQLKVSAAKWFRGEGSTEEGAARYYRLNMMEKRAVEHAFPSSIFTTFNGSDLRNLFPDRLPIFYMYSLRRGMSIKPWFIPGPAITADPVP